MLEIKNQADLDTILAQGTPVLLKFWGPNCGGCKALSPILDRMEPAYQDKVLFAAVDTSSEDGRLIAMRYGVMNLPTLIRFRGEADLHKLTGMTPRAEIERMLAETCE